MFINIIDKVREYIKFKRWYGGDYSLEDFAKECGVSVADVQNVLNRHFGKVSYEAVLKMFNVVEPKGIIYLD